MDDDWADEGFTAEQAAQWIALGVVDPDDACFLRYRVGDPPAQALIDLAEDHDLSALDGAQIWALLREED